MIFNNIAVRCFLVFLFGVTLISLTSIANDNYGIIQNRLVGEAVIFMACILTSVFYALFMGKEDAKLIITNHWSRAFIRVGLLSFYPVILFIQGANYSVLYLIACNLTSFYLVFEATYDIEKGESLEFEGNTAISDRIINWITYQSPLKKWLMKIPYWFFLVKIIIFILSIFLVFKYYVK